MPQVCGIESLYPSETLYPSDFLAPGSGKIFVPTLPLNPADFPIDDSAAIMVAGEDVISLGRFYPARFFNDLPEWFQGLPYQQAVAAEVLPEFEDDPDSFETKWWGLQRIVLRAIGREMARVDYLLRGRVTLSEYEANRSLPHATPPDDLNVFELEIDPEDSTLLLADASFVNPSTVNLRPRYEQVAGDTTANSAVITNLASTDGMYPGLAVQGTGIQGSTTGDTTLDSPIVTNIPSTTGYFVGAPVSGSGIAEGSRILTVDGPTQVTLDKDATATNAGTEITFDIRAVIVSVDSATQVTLNTAATVTDTGVPLTFIYRDGVRFYTNNEPVYAEGSGGAGLYYVFARTINDSQTIEILGATGGTLTFQWGSQITVDVPYNATAETLQAALEGFTFIEPGDLLVEELATSHWRVTASGSLSGTDIPLLISDDTNLTGAPEVVHGIEQEGNGGFGLALSSTDTPPDGGHVLIGDASWDGAEWTAVATNDNYIGAIANGQAYYDPFLDPQATDGLNPACAPLSQNEGLAPQLFAVTANWALDLWEQMLGLEVPSKNPANTIQYPERRARILRALLSTRAYTAAEFSYLAAARARELGITLGQFEEAQFSDPGWDSEDFVVEALNEIGFIQLNNTTSGTYRLSVDGTNWTGAIDAAASAATVETEILTLPQFVAGDVSVALSGGRYLITYGNNYEGVDVPAFEVDDSLLVGVAPGALVTTLQNGAAPNINEQQRLTLTNVTGGVLTLDFDGEITEAFPPSVSATRLAEYLSALPNIRPQDLEITAIQGQQYDIEFVDGLGAIDLAELIVDASGLEGIPPSISQGVLEQDIAFPGLWRGYATATPYLNYPTHGAPAESTYPYWIWASVVDIEGLDDDPAGAAVRVATLRDYIRSMTPAHLQVGFDWGPLSGFIVGISLVGIDRV